MSINFEGMPSIKRVHGKTTAFGRLIMKLSGGYIKDQRQANKIFIVITIALLAFSAYHLFTSFFS